MIGRHLLAAVLACCLLGGGLAAATWYVRSLQSRHIHTLAPRMFDLKNQGSALQAEAFRQSDLLVIYGSSELEFPNPYHASNVFGTYPTGFTVFPVGRGRTTSLVMLQDLAGVGSDLRGKKVAISVSPPWFFLHDRDPNFYAPNHSRLHLSALVFSTDLSYETRQAAARELLQSPKIFEGDPLVAFAARRLAEEHPLSRAQYLAVLPLGKLHNTLLVLQDALATYTFLEKQGQPDPQGPRGPTGIDWPSVTQAAETEYWRESDSNEYGFHNTVWNEKYHKRVPQRRGQFNDEWFIDNLEHTAEFNDLRLLLKGMTEMGAEPLVLSAPIPGKYYDYIGISPAARSEYYARLREVTATYNVTLVDFADHDNDIYFVTDPNSHLSRKGWTYYDRALDAFYHGSLGELARTEWSAGALLPGDIARAPVALR